MLKQFRFTVDCVITIRDITREDAERAYRDDPNVGCYLEEPEALQKVIEQQRRLLQAILRHDEVLHGLTRRYVYEYIRERLYDELPRPPEIDDELFLVMAGAIDELDFVDRALYLAYAAPRPEYEVEEDGDPFEQHTRLVRNSFYINLSKADLTAVEQTLE
jgi:hypothetical protein